MKLPKPYEYNKKTILGKVETVERVNDYLTKTFLLVENNVRFFRTYSSPNLTDAKKIHRVKIRELEKEIEELN